MVIRDTQIQRFDLLAEKGFEDELAAFVRKRMPTATEHLTPDELRAVLQKHIVAARGYGIASQSGMAQFVSLCFLPGPPFYGNELLHRFLSEAAGDPEIKIRMVTDRLTGELDRHLADS